jgi:hypothetical protein
MTTVCCGPCCGCSRRAEVVVFALVARVRPIVSCRQVPVWAIGCANCPTGDPPGRAARSRDARSSRPPAPTPTRSWSTQPTTRQAPPATPPRRHPGPSTRTPTPATSPSSPSPSPPHRQRQSNLSFPAGAITPTLP